MRQRGQPPCLNVRELLEQASQVQRIAPRTRCCGLCRADVEPCMWVLGTFSVAPRASSVPSNPSSVSSRYHTQPPCSNHVPGMIVGSTATISWHRETDCVSRHHCQQPPQHRMLYKPKLSRPALCQLHGNSQSHVHGMARWMVRWPKVPNTLRDPKVPNTLLDPAGLGSYLEAARCGRGPAQLAWE